MQFVMNCKMFINKATVTNLNKLNCCLYYNLINIRYASNNSNMKERIARKSLIQKHLALSYHETAKLLRKNPILQTIENLKLENTLEALNKMGIKKDDIVKNPMTLTLHYNTIEHHVMYLQEAGFEDVSAGFLLRFRNIVRKPIALLKVHGVISDKINVSKRLFSFLTPKPNSFPLLEKFNDEDSIVHLHEEIFKHYLVWRLDTSMEEINRIFKTYEKFKYRSFQLMSKMIKLLTKDLNFPKQKILSHSYLFQVNPQYPLQLIGLFPKIAGVDVRQILYKFPKIIAVPPENISTIIEHFKAYEVSDESLQNCFEIFTLCPDTILYRLNAMKQVPEFEALKDSNRYVRLLFNYNKAKLRLDLLQNAKVKSTSINLLVAPESTFEKYAIEGYDTNRGIDTIKYLSSALNIPTADLRQLLNHNPHWCQVPLVNIQDTLKYLIISKYPSDEIRRLPVILLYSRKIINKALTDIKNYPELHKVLLNQRETLNLCLYFIEKKYHFSGAGVWENKTFAIQDDDQIKDEMLEDLPVTQPETADEIKKRTLS